MIMVQLILIEICEANNGVASSKYGHFIKEKTNQAKPNKNSRRSQLDHSNPSLIKTPRESRGKKYLRRKYKFNKEKKRKCQGTSMREKYWESYVARPLYLSLTVL